MDVLKWITNPGLMIDWFKGKMQEFFLLPAKIASLKRRAADVKTLLEQKGDTGNAAVVASIDRDLDQVASSHSSLQSKVSGLFSKLGELGIKMPGMSGYQVNRMVGLGVIPAIPIAVLITAGAIALGIAGIFSDYAKQAALLKRVEEGSLTAEEAAKLGAGRALFGLDLGKLVPVALIIGGLVYGPRLLKARS